MARTQPARVQLGAEPTEPERRQITALCCTLVGAMGLAVDVDPEDLSQVTRNFQDTAVAAISGMGGTIATVTPDEVLAFFGYPEAHEDDAERATTAGLDAVAKIGQLVSPKGASLAGAELQGANLGRVQLQGAILRSTRLWGADLTDAQLQGAELLIAELQGASLRGAQLQGAELLAAKLQGADLSGAQLQGANLGRAELKLALLSDVFLWRAKVGNCSDARMTKPRFDAAIESSSKIGQADEPVAATPEAIAGFIERAVIDISGPRKEEVRKQLRAGLVADIKKEDLVATETMWRDCAANSEKVEPAEYDRQHADLLRDLFCDTTTNREDTAAGIIRNWGSDDPDRRDFFMRLARGLLGLDGRECAATKDLSDRTKELLRQFVSTPASDH